MKNVWLTPTRIIAVLAIIAIGVAVHAWSKTQPTSDFATHADLATPRVDTRFAMEAYEPDPSEVSAPQVKEWLELLRARNDGSSVFAQGIANLERLYAAMAPAQHTLLPNYPNPCNPETWIPYQLAKPVDVKISIYGADGRLVRTLALGYQEAGTYRSRARAAHWDGRNEVGEPVASGIYFYTLQAGDFTATKKLLIRK